MRESCWRWRNWLRTQKRLTAWVWSIWLSSPMVMLSSVRHGDRSRRERKMAPLSLKLFILPIRKASLWRACGRNVGARARFLKMLVELPTSMVSALRRGLACSTLRTRVGNCESILLPPPTTIWRADSDGRQASAARKALKPCAWRLHDDLGW